MKNCQKRPSWKGRKYRQEKLQASLLDILPTEKETLDKRSKDNSVLEPLRKNFLDNYFLQQDMELLLDYQIFHVGILPEDTGVIRYYKEGIDFAHR